MKDLISEFIYLLKLKNLISKNLGEFKLDQCVEIIERKLEFAKEICKQSNEPTECVLSTFDKIMERQKDEKLEFIRKKYYKLLGIPVMEVEERNLKKFRFLNEFRKIYLSLCANDLAMSSKGSILFSNTMSTGENPLSPVSL